MKMQMMLLILALTTFDKVKSQSVGVGTSSPASSSVLDVTSPNKGVLVPRLTTMQRNQIQNPANGLIIFNTTTNTLDYRDSSRNSWNNVGMNLNTDLPSGKLLVVYTATNAYGFYQNNIGSSFWTVQPLSSSPIGTANATGMVVLYNATTAYGLNQSGTSSGTWTSQSLSGTPLGIVASANTIVVYTTTNAYGFSRRSSVTAGSWTLVALAGQVLGHIASGQSVMVYTSTNAYTFYQNSNESSFWDSQAISGPPLGAINSQ